MFSTLRRGSRKDIENSFEKNGGKKKYIDKDNRIKNTSKLVNGMSLNLAFKFLERFLNS